MNLNDFIKQNRIGPKPYLFTRHVHCADGFTMSVQASQFTYASPRDNDGPYTAVEVGFPSRVEPLLVPFAEEPSNPTGTVYGWTPVELVEKVIRVHGGFARFPNLASMPKRLRKYARLNNHRT